MNLQSIINDFLLWDLVLHLGVQLQQVVFMHLVALEIEVKLSILYAIARARYLRTHKLVLQKLCNAWKDG